MVLVIAVMRLETANRDLVPVPADSELLEGFPEKNLEVELGFVYDQLWLILPFWTKSGSFALYPVVEPSAKPDKFWILNEQDAGKLAKMLGVPAERLTQPFYYRLPFGWLAIVGAVVFVKLTSGPSAETRFKRLWDDDRFRAAVATVLGQRGRPLPDEFEALGMMTTPAVAETRLDEEVQKLQDQGVSRRKARRDLEFLIRYLGDNGKLVPVPPLLDSGAAEGSPPSG